MNKYKEININILEKEILIEIRKRHVRMISNQLVEKNIITHEYLDNLIRLKTMRNGTIDMEINNKQRIDLLDKLLQVECCKGTAKWINEL